MTLDTPTRVLHIDDNAADIEYAQESCLDCGCNAEFEVATDGDAALARLRAIEAGECSRPDLVLLDLNLPRVKGHDVLGYIRSRPVLRGIPVVVLTSSPSRQERQRSLDLGATDHVQKPTGFEQTRELIGRLQDLVLGQAGSGTATSSP